MIDGLTSRPFSAKTIAPAPVEKDHKKREEIIRISRSKYARKVGDVEEEINRWAANQAQTAAVSGGGGQQQQKRQNMPRNGASQGRVQPDGTTLYDAVCSNCNKATKVVFPPTEGRAIYCKSCLKKMKSGNSAQAGEAQLKPGVQTGKPDKSPEGHFDGPATISPKASLGGKPDKDKALADLGIEFAPSADGAPSRMTGRPPSPAPQKSFSLNEIMKKGENVPFNKNKRNNNEGGQKKEVDLADLRKTLDQALKSSPPSSSEDENKPN